MTAVGNRDSVRGHQGQEADIWIVVLNYRTPGLAIDCLGSIEAQVRALIARVVVVDNASGDGSLAQLGEAIGRHGWDSWASLLPLAHNGGYAAGNNAAVRLAMAQTPPPRYVLILNPDTVVRPDAIGALCRFMDATPRAGIAGSRLLSPTGEVECSAHRAPSVWGELDNAGRLGVLTQLLSRHIVSPPPRDTPHRCDWVSGSSMIIRREVFEAIGLLDERYFLYFEEVDFCTRARRAGWEVWSIPQSVILHLEGSATGIRRPGARRAGYWFDSRRRYFLKHHGLAGLLAADLFWAVGRLAFLLRKWLGPTRVYDADPAYLERDLLWGDLRAMIT